MARGNNSNIVTKFPEKPPRGNEAAKPVENSTPRLSCLLHIAKNFWWLKGNKLGDEAHTKCA